MLNHLSKHFEIGCKVKCRHSVLKYFGKLYEPNMKPISKFCVAFLHFSLFVFRLADNSLTPRFWFYLGFHFVFTRPEFYSTPLTFSLIVMEQNMYLWSTSINRRFFMEGCQRKKRHKTGACFLLVNQTALLVS